MVRLLTSPRKGSIHVGTTSRPRVVLIVTGRLEEKALPAALRRLFPSVDFLAEYWESFTSNPLVPGPVLGRPLGATTLAEKIAKAMVLALDPGRKGTHADYAFAVVDLELANDHQPERVVSVFREAVRSCLPSLHNTAYRQTRCETQVPLRCSFHLFRPMIEAYFFADPSALKRRCASRQPSLDPRRDIEEFLTDDPEYQKVATNARTTSPESLRHPKLYLRWLCDPRPEPGPRSYRETKGGAATLRELDWNRVLGEPGRCPFLRSFVLDLADALDLPAPCHEDGCNPLTARYNPSRRDPVLRNI